VRCDDYREIFSAMLDAEATPDERARAEDHLATCEGCQRWWQAATTLTRLARTAPPLDPPAVPDSVLDAAPRPARARLAHALRAVLGVLGGVQLALGLVQVSGFGQGTLLHDGHAVPVTATDHLWHESAAWNIAIGAAFLWIALRAQRPTGVLPILTAFVATLTVLSASDLIAGRVETGRLISHALILTGYTIILALTRPALDFGQPPAGPRHPTTRWRVHGWAERPQG
jgi:predicted anti-sigma-YlaC factor YlaD